MRDTRQGYSIQLPVSGIAVALRPPTGADELLMLETPDDLSLALALADRLAHPVDVSATTEPRDWSGLTATDLDVLILRLRQSTTGDRVLADVPCQAAGCGARIDVSFGVDQYLEHHLPKAQGAGERGEWLLAAEMWDDEPVSFRLPTIADQLSARNAQDGVGELARRCLRPTGVPAECRARVEGLMEAIAPNLAREVSGTCPECGGVVSAFFDPRRYCLTELRDRAAFAYADVDLLARRYHWTEADILSLPRERRTRYAELARLEGAA